MLNSADAASGAPLSAVDPHSSNEAAPSPQLDIKDFIHTQLKENTRDRLFMLNVERDLLNFIKNQKEEYHKFQAMNPYYRMLTHRICEYFGLGHNLDNSKQSVIVFKLAERPTLPTLPSLTFQAIINTSEQKQQVKQASMGSESGSDSSSSNSLTPNSSSNNLAALQETKIEKKQILKRDTNDQENLIRLNKKTNEIKPKTFEEKSAEYNRIKNRIFNNLSDNSDSDKASNQNVQIKETEVKQYKILNRTGKTVTEVENGENANFSSNQKSQKKVQSKPKTTSGLKKPVQTKIFSAPTQVMHTNYRQMVPQYPTGQFVYMNQGGNYQHQFNSVMFSNVPHMVGNGGYQMMPNQTSGLLMHRAPILQIPSVNSQTNSPSRPSPKTRPKFESPVNKKPLVKASDRIKNIKFQVYNLSADLTKAKLNELLAPYIFKMEIMDKKTSAIQNGDDGKSSLLDEASIDILIEFDNFDKIEEAFKDLNLNGGPQSTSPFLIKPVC